MEGADIAFSWCNNHIFVNWFALITAVVTEDVQLTFTEEKGISVSTFDQANHIGFVESNVSPRAFSRFYIKPKEDGKPHQIAIDLKVFSVIMGKIGALDDVIVRYFVSTDKFRINIRSPATKQLAETESEWYSPTVDKEYDEVKQLAMPWSTSVTVPSADLFRMVKNLSDVSDIASMCIDRSGFEMQVDTDIGGTIQRINEFSTGNVVQLLDLKPPTNPGVLHLTLKVLKQVTLLCKLSSLVEVSLHIDEAQPALRVAGKFEKDQGCFAFWQAGRSKDNDIF